MVVGHNAASLLTNLCKLLQLCIWAIPSPALDVWPWNLLSLLIFQQCWWILVSLCNRMAERRGRQSARVTDLTSYCLRVLLWFTLMFSGLLQKDLFKGGWSLAKNFFKPNYCHACHTRFSIFFPLPPCCVSSLLLLVFITNWKKKNMEGSMNSNVKSFFTNTWILKFKN